MKQKEKRSTFNVQRSTSKEGSINKVAPEIRIYDLEDRLFDFSARIISVVDALPASRAANHIAGQLIRCGTSPLPNHGEAQAAESRADFIHKLKICHKELRETRRWLRLIVLTKMIAPATKAEPLLDETTELIRIFYRSIRTAEQDATSYVREDGADIGYFNVES